MSDPEDSAPLVGQYSAPAPSLDPSSFSTQDSIEAVVNDLVYNSDASKASLSKCTTAEAWFDLEDAMKAAEQTIADVNDGFAKQIKAVGDALEGDAGDAFNHYANAVLETSEQVYSTLMQKHFGATMGNIGHAIQVFADGWWTIHDASEHNRASIEDIIKGDAQRKIDATHNLTELYQITTQLQTDLADAKTQCDEALLKDLQNALGALGAQYNNCAGQLVRLFISDGDTSTAAPAGSYQAQAGKPGAYTNVPHDEPNTDTTVPPAEPNADTPVPQQGETNPPPVIASPPVEDLAETPGDVAGASDGQGPGIPAVAGATSGGPTDVGAGMPAVSGVPSGGPTDAGAAPTTTGGPDGTTGQGGTSPEQQAALDNAKAAAGDAIDDLTSQSNDPQRTKALQDAKQAAQGAIDGLTNPSTPGELAGDAGGGAIPTASGPDPATQHALQQAKDAADKAIGGLAGQTDDPKRKKALEDAKQAADEAIDGLTSPAGAPGQLTGGPDEAGVEAAKNAASKAIDDLAKPDDSEARSKALDDAKQAALDAMGDPGTHGGATDGAAAGDQQDRAHLLDAKHAAQKAIDGLISNTDDPERKKALEDAKDAMSDAIDKTAAPEHFQQVEDAKHAADKAIDGLRESGDDPQRQHALDAAKSAADEAIEKLNDTPELSGPGHEEALEHAKQEADKAIDALCKPDDTPAERQALADAKEAVNKAIDGIGEESQSPTALQDFLQPHGSASPGGGGVTAGGGHGPVVPDSAPGPVTGGGAASSGGPGAPDGPALGKFDTQPAQGGPAVATQGGPAVPVTAGQVPANASGGMPMAPPMGGMGGGGGAGNQNKEREPQIWMQAEQGAWGEGDQDEPRSHVLGRS